MHSPSQALPPGLWGILVLQIAMPPKVRVSAGAEWQGVLDRGRPFPLWRSAPGSRMSKRTRISKKKIHRSILPFLCPEPGSQRGTRSSNGATPESPWPLWMERGVFTDKSQSGPEFETMEVGRMLGSAYKWIERPFPFHAQTTWKSPLPGATQSLPKPVSHRISKIRDSWSWPLLDGRLCQGVWAGATGKSVFRRKLWIARNLL